MQQPPLDRSPRFRRTDTLGLTVDAAPSLAGIVRWLDEALERRTPLLVTFVNPSAWTIAKAQPDYRRQLTEFDAVLPDGIGMRAALRGMHRLPAVRISFDMTSLAPAVFAGAARNGRSVVLVGGVPGRADAAATRLRGLYPGIPIPATFDGFRDPAQTAADIVALQPAIVICGMGCGRQEAFLLDLARLGWRGCGFTCGGFLDQLVAGATYYPGWIDRLDLRWAYRLAKEPRRLWRRYLLSYPPFFAQLGLALLARPAASR